MPPFRASMPSPMRSAVLICVAFATLVPPGLRPGPSLAPAAAAAPGPMTVRPMVAGPMVTGPMVPAPMVTGPIVTGPIVAGHPTCWLPPVGAPVVDPFRRPECPWCPGNRGLKYGTGSGAPVRAVASGIVSYSGRVAGTGYVVVRHADGIRATYGGLTEPFRAQGSFVPAGAIVGTTEQNLHFGLRDEEDYLDPTPLIGRLFLQARLLPLDGTPPRQGRIRLVCSPRRGGARPRSR